APRATIGEQIGFMGDVRIRPQRDPHIVRLGHRDAAKLRRRNADDLCRVTVYQQPAPEGIVRAVEMILPELVTQDDLERRFLSGPNVPATRQWHAKYRKVVVRNERSGDAVR